MKASLAAWHILVTPARRIVDAWLGNANRGSAIWFMLVPFVAAWSTYQIVSYSSIDLHPDFLEVFAWSRHLSAGYYKHPPLAAIIAAAWFQVFPIADWSFYLLSATNAAVALFFVDLIARRYLSAERRLLVPLLLLLTPFYQFRSEPFSTNQTLLSVWPLATYCFLRAFETRAIGWAAAAGATATTAMMGKYYSIFLLGGFCLAALIHSNRRAYLTSPSPWISIVVSLVLLTPHLYWLVNTDFLPFQYVESAYGGEPMMTVLQSIVEYLTGGVAYVALPVAIYLIVAKPSLMALRAALWPADPDLRMLIVLLAGDVILPVILAPILHVRLTSVWNMQSWFLLPIILLTPKQIVVSRTSITDIGAGVLLLTAAVVVAAPAVAWVYHIAGTKQGRGYSRLVAAQVTDEWHRMTGRPVDIVVGDGDLAAAVTFYSPDHPDAVPGFNLRAAPWVTSDRLTRDGWVAVCKADDGICTAELGRRQGANPHAARLDIELTPVFWGVRGNAARFVVTFFPPVASR